MLTPHTLNYRKSKTIPRMFPPFLVALCNIKKETHMPIKTIITNQVTITILKAQQHI